MSQEPRTGDLLPAALRKALPSAPAGTHHRVLYFMRTIDCVICRGHVRRLAELSPKLRTLAADVVVFAPAAGAETAADWIAAQPFPILLNDDVHATAGLGRALFGQLQQSGTIVIDDAGRVVLARRATLPFQSFSEPELLERLASAAAA